MSIFDLLFILAFLSSFVYLVVVVITGLRGRRQQALKLLRNWGIFLAAYFAIGMAVSWLKPQKIIAVGDPWCFDDWCLMVEKTTPTAGASQTSYKIDMKIFSRAGRISQRANGAWLYLIDEQGRLYAPEPNASDVPLNVLLGPNESVSMSRIFKVRPDVQRLGLITGHGGPYCGAMTLFIIGESGCLFHKPSMIQIQ